MIHNLFEKVYETDFIKRSDSHKKQVTHTKKMKMHISVQDSWKKMDVDESLKLSLKLNDLNFVYLYETDLSNFRTILEISSAGSNRTGNLCILPIAC